MSSSSPWPLPKPFLSGTSTLISDLSKQVPLPAPSLTPGCPPRILHPPHPGLGHLYFGVRRGVTGCHATVTVQLLLGILPIAPLSGSEGLSAPPPRTRGSWSLSHIC